MQVNIRADIKPLQKQAQLTQKKTGFATANTLTKVARRAERYEKIKVGKDLHRPTPFTVRGFKSFRASPRRLEAGVFIQDIQFRYLFWQIYGGVQRFRKRRPVPYPAVKVNQYGNLTRKRSQALRARPNVFSVGADKELTVRADKRGRWTKLLRWIRKAAYRRRFRFFHHGHHIVNTWLVKDWNRAVSAELRRTGRQ